MAPLSLSLIVPVFNEEKNILPLVADISAARGANPNCPAELILINNGSRDGSAEKIAIALQKYPWARCFTLDQNMGYGGGVYRGLLEARPDTTHLGWIPADRQYRIEDLVAIWDRVLEKPEALHKGLRETRADGLQSRTVSRVYSALCAKLLKLPVRDANGLPKVFPRTLLEKNLRPLATNFVLDTQICLLAATQGLEILEHPVHFLARREGVSSWSGKRVRTYLQTALDLLLLKV